MENIINTVQEKTNIHLPSLIIGIAVFTVIASLGFIYDQSLLFALSAIGLIYTGYHSKNFIWGIGLGAIGTIPLIIISAYYNFIGWNNTTDIAIVAIALLLTGAIIGMLGAYVKRGRSQAKAAKENLGKNKNKNKKN